MFMKILYGEDLVKGKKSNYILAKDLDNILDTKESLIFVNILW